MKERPRIMVIDDDELVGRALQRSLSRACIVELVSTTRAGLESIRSGREYDMILLDYCGMDVAAFVRSVAKARPGQEHAIVIHTGMNTLDPTSPGVTSAGGRLMEKPAPRNELLFAARALRDSRARRARAA